MVRQSQKQRKQKTVEEDFGLDEVDSFHAEREKILLDETAAVRRGRDEDEDSEEEVMDVNDDSESEGDDEGKETYYDDDSEYFGKKDEIADLQAEADEEGHWGDSKRNYYGADDAEDDETAKQIEEEALRLQKKHLEELNMDDYLDEDMEEEWTKAAKKHDLGDVLDTIKKEEHQTLSKLDPQTRKKVINTTHPEFIPLSKELTKWKPILDDLSERRDANEVTDVKFTALSAYLGAISSYFALFIALTKEDEPFTMKEHPVMESILSSKELWRQAEELEETEENEEIKEVESDVSDSEMEDVPSNDRLERFNSMSEGSESEEEEEESEEEDQELDIDISKPRVFKKAKAQNIEDYAEGEIADVDAEEKKRRKKTLRFYTSKIDQQEMKKNERYGGDLDIPYKERLFERQQRLIEEARKRGLNDKNGADLDQNEDLDAEDLQNAKSVNSGFEESYYDTVQKNKEDSRTKRKEAHQLAVKAAKEGKLAELQENADEEGKRAVNYQILKNKGLTPNRKKVDRNSRVKKRVRYEQAKKKLKSVRSVYTAPTGAYEGEKTGIKKGLTKSVKF